MPSPKNRSLGVGLGDVIIFGAVLALILVYLVGTNTTEPGNETPVEKPAESTPVAVPEITPPPLPACYDIHKFCIGLWSLEDEMVGSDGRIADEESEEPSWRVVTANVWVSLRSGETDGTFTDASVALIDTAGVRHSNDNFRAGLADQSVNFHKLDRMPTTITVVFFLGGEKVECVEITERYTNETLCLRP